MANKPRPNYFDQNIRQYGEDFLLTISPEKIQRDAKQRIFKEMIQGRIDYVAYNKYFTDSKFFENLLIASRDELQNNQLIATALELYDRSCPGNQLLIILKAKYQSLSYVYNVLYGALINVKTFGYNVGYLSDLSAILYQYRNQL